MQFYFQFDNVRYGILGVSLCLLRESFRDLSNIESGYILEILGRCERGYLLGFNIIVIKTYLVQHN